MKTLTIELTDGQTEQLIKVDAELLLSNKDEAIEKIEKAYQIELSKLKNKYKTIDVPISSIDIDKPKKTNKKVSDEEMKQLFEEGKSVKEISSLTGKTEPSIRIHFNKLGLKLKERKNIQPY